MGTPAGSPPTPRILPEPLTSTRPVGWVGSDTQPGVQPPTMRPVQVATVAARASSVSVT